MATSKANDYRKTIFGRPNTVKAKLNLFDNHIAPFSGESQVEAFYERVFKHWQTSGLSATTVKMLLVILKDFIKFAWQVDIDTKRLKFKYFGNQVTPVTRVKVWTKPEVVSALNMAETEDKELFEIMTVALGTGLRKGELFGLTWSDVDVLGGTITVNKSLDTETRELGPTKTKQERVIQMSGPVAKILEKSYTPGKEEARCFRTFNPNKRLLRICKLAGVPEISFHDLRHTFATTCLEKGMSPKWVSATLGHAKLTTTLDVYWQHFKEKVDLENLYD